LNPCAFAGSPNTFVSAVADVIATVTVSRNGPAGDKYSVSPDAIPAAPNAFVNVFHGLFDACDASGPSPLFASFPFT
jgi:hypothetical protein